MTYKRITITDEGIVIVLPCGMVVEGKPQGSELQSNIAKELGYGSDVLSMVKDYDPLHVLLCEWLGISKSFSIEISR